MKITKRLLCVILAMCLLLCTMSACGKDYASKIPDYPEKQFEISGFWAPYEITEESFKQYKDVGFTHLAMINHSLNKTSEEQFYLSSERTMKALELCKKVGLKAILNYNDWIATWSENDLDYYGETPFSKYDLYGDYKDIITGVHICDEPYLKRPDGSNHFETYGNKTLVDDFKKVYPNAEYIVNLIPFTAYPSRGFDSYEQMMELYEKTFMEPFENPYVSVDVYPFHQNMTTDDGTLLVNYRYIADSAKKYGIKPGFILQSSIGGADEGTKEFEMSLSEADLRWEINNALAFGADTLQYYCYSVPKSFDEDGNDVFMYDECILKRDNTPSDIYYSLQKLHKEIQSYANVILAYDWDVTIGASGKEDTTFRVSTIELDEDFNAIKLKDTQNYVDSTSTLDMTISRFTSDEYGEAYMFLNWADRGTEKNIITATFKNCDAVAIYGGAGFDGTPSIVELDENDNVIIELEYGESAFVTPITK